MYKTLINTENKTFKQDHTICKATKRNPNSVDKTNILLKHVSKKKKTFSLHLI